MTVRGVTSAALLGRYVGRWHLYSDAPSGPTAVFAADWGASTGEDE